MSASTEKKLRRAARETGNVDKNAAAKKEAAKKAKRKLWWIVGIAGFAVLLAVLLVFTSSAFKDSTTALTIKDRDYSPAEVNYYYASQYHYFTNQYGDLAAFMGLNTSYGLPGLASQTSPYAENEGGTWRDYFIGTAKKEMARVQALYEYGLANGISLDEAELKQIDDSFVELESFARVNGYDMDTYLSLAYGSGVTAEIARQAAKETTLADKVASNYAKNLEYTDEELNEFYLGFNGERDYYDYAYYYVKAEEVEGADGEEAPTEETLSAAKATAEAIVEEYKKAADSSVADALDAAVKKLAGADAKATARSNVLGSEIDVGKEWLLAGGQKLGDTSVIDNDGKGYFVVAFINHNDNDYNTKQVRHILVMAQPGEDGTYSEEAKKAAKARAEELLATWEAGEKTEESFADLAILNSEDSDTSANGGLYEAVVKGQMVKEFDAFCYDENRKYGDTAIVFGENGFYTGYHVMFYVGEGENCRLHLARIDLVNQTTEAWVAEQQSGYEAKEHYGLRFVG